MTAAIYGTDAGIELRIGFSETELIHAEVSREGPGPLLVRAANLRLVLFEKGWIELRASSTTQ